MYLVEPSELIGQFGLSVISQQHRFNVRQPKEET